MSGAALQAQKVRAVLGGVEVLHGLDVSIPSGQWTSVVGPNGAGKSTLLKVLAGILPHQGQVLLLGRPLLDLPARQRARWLAWLGQNEGGPDDLRAYDVVMLGRLPHRPWLGAPADLDHSIVQQALRQTQAWEWRDRTLGELSGGERQRVLMARALAVQGQVLLLDEPLASLDPPHQVQWLQLMRALVARGTTVVSVLHEISLALRADNMLILESGRVRHAGGCADPLTHRALEQVFVHSLEVRSLDTNWIALPRT